MLRSVVYIPHRDALIALYNATDGDNWSNNDNWLSSKPIGEWYGVTANERGRVTKLDLTENGLHGTLPSDLGNLTNLTTLYLSHNSLIGSIPPDLGNLTSLEFAQLRGNQLSGPIPSELANLASVRQLDLSDNLLSGSIPPELGSLPNLEALWLLNNQLTGCVPPGLLDALRNAFSELDLPTCGQGVVTDASADREALVAIYQAMGGWTTWNVRRNWMTDRPIGEWYGVTTDADGRVTALELPRNEMGGIVPAALGDLTSLTSLDLSGNYLVGILPQELGKLTGLQTMYFSGNSFAGCIPEGLKNVQSNDFSELGMQFCPIGELAMAFAVPVRSGESAEDRAVLTALYNAAGGAGWKNSQNWLTDEPIWEWYGVSADASGHVTRLVLFENGLAGAIPPELGNLTNLRLLVLSENDLAGPIPHELGPLATPRIGLLEGLYLYGNDLTGCIPEALLAIPNYDLQELGLLVCDPTAPAESSTRLQQVRNRGTVVCSGANDIPGFGYLDQSGHSVGIEVDLCRAVASAVLRNPNAIDVRLMSAAERVEAIQSGEVDVSVTLPGWLTTHDEQRREPVHTMLYDGLGFVVNGESGISNALELAGATVCVTHGSIAARSLEEFSAANDLAIVPITFEDTWTVLVAYGIGQCDAATASRLQMAALLASASTEPGAHLILPDTITDEPLGPVVPPGDSQWSDVVKTVISILIHAEALGVGYANVPSAATGDPAVDRLFGFLGPFAQEDLGLSPTVAQDVIRAVGNYGEIYDRHLGPNGIDLPRKDSANALWADAPCTDCPKGGMIHADSPW